MINFVKSVSYVKKTMLSSEEYFQIKILKDKNVVRYYNTKSVNALDNPIIKEIDNEMPKEFLDQLFRIIDGWENEYINSNFLDGIEWQLEIKYQDNEVLYYSGKNDFPDNFEYLDRLKYKLLNDCNK